MEKLTGEQILKRLNELFKYNISAFAYGDYSEAEGVPYDLDLNWSENEKNALDFIGLGEIKEIEQYGGEDQGSTWYSIKHFVDHDVYIRTDGYYQSYHGTDFYSGIGKVVTPQKKTITVFQ